MVFVADDLGAWLVGLLADTGRKKLGTWVLGTPQERELWRAGSAAVWLTARELSPGDDARVQETAMVLNQVFSVAKVNTPYVGMSTVLETVQAAIAGQLAILDDADQTGTGRSSAELLGVSTTAAVDALVRNLVHEIMIRGSGGGPLQPLAAQINHDVTHLQGERLEAMLARMTGPVREVLARLDAGRPSAAPPQRAVGEPPYLSTVRTIRDHTTVLRDRDQEMSHIESFAKGSDEAFGKPAGSGYLWLMSGPWAGKTALLAHAACSLPQSVDVVAYFLVAREAEASQEQFLAAVVPQLSWILREEIPVTIDVHVFRSLWAKAAERSRASGRPLLLIVDGLDEDLRPSKRSVAALLPTTSIGRHARVLVSSRRHPGIPIDVEAHHPLRSAPVVDVDVSPYGSMTKTLVEQETSGLLDQDRQDSELAHDVLGLLTAASGPLAVRDLAAMTGQPVRRVRTFITSRAARSLEQVPSDAGPYYRFAHQSILEYCRADPDIGDLSFRDRLYAWADEWRDRGWPPAGPKNSGTPHYLLDAYPMVLAVTSGAGDQDAPELDRLAALSTDVGWVDSAIAYTGVQSVMATFRTIARIMPWENRVAALLRLLQLQAYPLQSSASIPRPGFAATQIRWEALRNRHDSLKESLRPHMRSCPGPQLIPAWTTETNRPHLLGAIGQHDGPVKALAVLPDGRVASGSTDGRVLVWDLDHLGSPIHELGQHPEKRQRVVRYGTDPKMEFFKGISHMAILADGRLVTSGFDRRVLAWRSDLGPAAPVELVRHESLITALTALSTGQLVSGDLDGKLKVWSSDDRAAPLYAPADVLEVSALSTLPDGNVIIGSAFGNVLVWDPRHPRRRPRELGSHDDRVSAVTGLPDGRVVSGGRDGTVRLWSPKHPRQPGTLLGRHGPAADSYALSFENLAPRGGWVTALAVLPDGRIVSAGYNGRIKIWDPANSGSPGVELARTAAEVYALTALRDGRVVSGNHDGLIQLWDTGRIEDAHDSQTSLVYAVHSLPDGRILSGDARGKVCLWQWDEDGPRCVVLGRCQGGVFRFARLTDGRIVSAGESGLHLWNPDDPQGRQGVKLGRSHREGDRGGAEGQRRSDEAYAIGVLADGRVVSGGMSGIFLWDPARPGRAGVRLGPRVRQPASPLVKSSRKTMITGVAVLADGRLVSSGPDGMFVRDPNYPERQGTRLGATTVPALAMLALPDGKLACGSFDGAVSLWDLNRPDDPAIVLGRHDEYVCTLRATPDARNIVSCGADGVVKMWDPARPGSAAIELTRADCEISDLTFTPDRRYLAIASRGISVVEYVFAGH